MILRKQENVMIFFTAPRNFTLIRASEQILDVPRLLLLVLLAVRMTFWPRHIAVYTYTIVTRVACRSACNFDRRIHFCTCIRARRWRRWRASVCICQAQEQKRTVNRFYERGRADPPPLSYLVWTPYEPPANPRERVIYRKCNRRRGAIHHAWGRDWRAIFFF